MTVAPEKIAEAERARVRAAFAAAGGRGMTEAERSDQLGALRGKLRRAFARRELEWRQREAAGVDVERGAADAEMFLRSGQDLADIAAGKEPD